MENAIAVVIQVAIGAAVAFVAWKLFWWWRDRRRRAAIRTLAEKCKAEFFDIADRATIDGLAEFELFTKRPEQRIENMLVQRQSALLIAVFDYRWKSYGVDSDSGDTLERRTVVHVTSRRLRLPQFYLCPNRFWQKLTSIFREKIAFDDHPHFMRRYDLRGKQPAMVRELFHPGLLQMLETEPRTLVVEGGGNQFILFPQQRGFFGDGRSQPEEFPALLGLGEAFCQQLLTRAGTDEDIAEVNVEVIDDAE